MSAAERLRSHYESLDRAIGFTKAADAKAGPLLGLQIALAGVLARQWDGLRSVFGESSCLEQAVLVVTFFLRLLGVLEGPAAVPEQTVLVVMFCLYAIPAIFAIVFALRVFIPVNPQTGKSLIYFEDITAQDFESFQAQAKAMRPMLIEHQLIDQIHRVSTIASCKMRRVRLAFQMSIASSIFWIVLLAWISMR